MYNKSSDKVSLVTVIYVECEELQILRVPILLPFFCLLELRERKHNVKMLILKFSTINVSL